MSERRTLEEHIAFWRAWRARAGADDVRARDRYSLRVGPAAVPFLGRFFTWAAQFGLCSELELQTVGRVLSRWPRTPLPMRLAVLAFYDRLAQLVIEKKVPAGELLRSLAVGSVPTSRKPSSSTRRIH